MSEGHLKSLYPFLHGGPGGAELEATLARSVEEKARESRASNERFFASQAKALVAAARALAQCYRGGGRLFTMGNGGSSCDAAHVAVEFQHPVTAGRPALPAIDLCAQTAMVSAVANDVGYEHVFVRQLLALGRRGDALLGISTSGNSANLIAAFAKAREMGIATIGLAGAGGGRMKSSGLVEHCLVVPGDSIHRIQETQVAAYHVLWDLVHELLAHEVR